MKNILLTVEYDGAGFHGWQKQPGARTAQGELEAALSAVCRAEVSVHGASRTDAGVHAYGQRASFRGDFGIPAERLARAVNNLLGCGIELPARDAGPADGKAGAGLAETGVCAGKSKTDAGRVPRIGMPGDLRVREAARMPEDFHARYDAKGKKYIYRILSTPQTDIFLRNSCWQMAETLDANAMRAAARHIVGTRDFRAFQAAGGHARKTTVRTLFGLNIETKSAGEGRSMTVIEVTGDGFLYNMVRIIAGTLALAGTGRMDPEDVRRAVESLDRRNAGPTAPPQGLYLAEVYY
ncbi:MAG: tRNA pseudouridine synthase A [Clostridiales Family XIII bacterium]|jgi:tRNA pseudouridine38-40 synthase|nr:tRNA pseudouridine synthase A [Clostridiales Family XIII bacterium]